MARVQLQIDDPAGQMTLKAILEAEGHTIVENDGHVLITDDTFRAIEHAKTAPTLLLARAAEIREAVAAMKQGVYGYLYVPFQPGEAGLMVRRALNERHEEEVPQLLPLEEIERRHILTVLRLCKHSPAKAAKILGIARNTLWRKLSRMKESGPLEPK